jgi:hypothetical protein
MERIGTIEGEVNAEIIRGLLDSNDIQANVAPWGALRGRMASGGSYAVYVERDKIEAALGLLKDFDFIRDSA